MISAPEAEVELRQRKPSDIPILFDVLKAVYAEKDYPVDGPSCFDALLNPPPDEVLHTITAVLRPTDPDGDVDQPIVGHAMIMSPTAGGGLSLASKMHLEGGGTMENHAVLSRFFVSPAAQARGIGAKMLEEAVAWARRQGKRLVLEVLEKDEGAVRLYDRARWVRVGEDVFTSKWGTGYNAMAYLGPAVSQVSRSDLGD
ncbi:acyl-CoA N-acyltransferase [Diaporthe sp. PMI_573]|nr:acyl-CoA N-acyltransferase [Diaporthaceae sp. PMI_573]